MNPTPNYAKWVSQHAISLAGFYDAQSAAQQNALNSVYIAMDCGAGATASTTTAMTLAGGNAGATCYPVGTMQIYSGTAPTQMQMVAHSSNILCPAGHGGVLPAQPDRHHPPNRFLEASDRLEEFLRSMSAEGVGRAELLELPIELFISWLIVEAATAEGSEIPDNVLSPRQRLAFLPRRDLCRGCNGKIPDELMARGLQWCKPECVGLAFKASETPKLILAA